MKRRSFLALFLSLFALPKPAPAYVLAGVDWAKPGSDSFTNVGYTTQYFPETDEVRYCGSISSDSEANALARLYELKRGWKAGWLLRNETVEISAKGPRVWVEFDLHYVYDKTGGCPSKAAFRDYIANLRVPGYGAGRKDVAKS